MRLQVVKFTSLSVCLKELEPFIRNGQHLHSGKPFEKFGGLRSREILANWLTCVAVNSVAQPERLTFTSDPTGSDGIITDTKTGETWITEHVMVPPPRKADSRTIEDKIIDAIDKKQKKGGAAYARGKSLIVFLESGGGTWFPNAVAKRMPTIDFETVWVVGLEGVTAGAYAYGVTRLDLTRGNVPVWRVRVAADFKSWEVVPVQ